MNYHLPLLVTIVLAAPSQAHADDYRLAVGVTDLASATVFTIGIKLDLDCKPCFATAAVGFAGMALGAPIIHAAEGNYGRMGISLGARVLLPTLGLMVAVKTGVTENMILGGFLLGFVGASIIDVALASEEADMTGVRRTRMVSIGARF